VFRRRRREEEFRQFIRELLLRFDRSTAAQREESRRYFDALHAQAEQYDERENRRLDELLEDHRAQRGALLAILDRLDNGGPASATP
jgi:hypothetical protein